NRTLVVYPQLPLLGRGDVGAIRQIAERARPASSIMNANPVEVAADIRLTLQDACLGLRPRNIEAAVVIDQKTLTASRKRVASTQGAIGIRRGITQVERRRDALISAHCDRA